MKIRLKRFNTLIDTDEHSQEVQYFYGIEDSTGLLEINLNIPEESDPVEYFVIHIKDLYKDIQIIMFIMENGNIQFLMMIILFNIIK